ncbi:MAG: GNAT family N-acetyltransferase [Muricoprocola sp.]
MSSLPEIQIRIATVSDAAAILAIYKPYVEHTAITFEYEVPSLEEFSSRITSTLQKYPYIVAELNDKIVAYAYVSSFHSRPAYDWCVETSIYIDQGCRRMGIGRKLYDALENILKKMGILNLNACIAYPVCEDPYLTLDSVDFHEKLGYHIVGHFSQCGYKFNRWYDMVWMEKFIGEHKEKQPPVISFPEIADSLVF